jgi:hypothetical protein
MAGELVVSTINGAGFDGANVIINPEFALNQRGAVSRTAATGYNFDRWYYDGTRLLQGVEGNNLRAGTYVLSWSGSSTAEFSLNTAAASGQGSESYTAVTNGGTITIASVGSNNLWVRFSSDLTNLTRVKLSPGTEASGFVARPYGTELALCQRYAVRIDAALDVYTRYGIGECVLTTQADVFVQLPVEMRTRPTSLTTTGTASNYAMYAAGSVRPCATVPTIQQASTPKIALVIASVASGLTAGGAGQFISNNNTTSYLVFSAEL